MVSLTRGILITFEGTEGSGKSTLIGQVSSQLRSLKIPFIATREPGGSELAEKIRDLILHSEMDSRTELFLYEAARADHLSRVILPALERKQIILCDRFTDSTLAYQASARGLPWAEVKRLNQSATCGIQPHLTVFLDLDPQLGLNRAKDPNRFEAEGLAFQKKVRRGFLKSRQESPQRWLTLKVGNRTPEELAETVVLEIHKRFKRYLRGTAEPKHGR